MMQKNVKMIKPSRAVSRANSKSKYKTSGTFLLNFQGITSLANHGDA